MYWAHADDTSAVKAIARPFIVEASSRQNSTCKICNGTDERCTEATVRKEGVWGTGALLKA